MHYNSSNDPIRFLEAAMQHNVSLRVRNLEEVQHQKIGAVFMSKSLGSNSLPMTNAARQASDGRSGYDKESFHLVR